MVFYSLQPCITSPFVWRNHLWQEPFIAVWAGILRVSMFIVLMIMGFVFRLHPNLLVSQSMLGAVLFPRILQSISIFVMVVQTGIGNCNYGSKNMKMNGPWSPPGRRHHVHQKESLLLLTLSESLNIAPYQTVPRIILQLKWVQYWFNWRMIYIWNLPPKDLPLGFFGMCNLQQKNMLFFVGGDSKFQICLLGFFAATRAYFSSSSYKSP